MMLLPCPSFLVKLLLVVILLIVHDFKDFVVKLFL